MPHPETQVKNWGVIFLVNLAPSDELGSNDSWKEIILKENYFTSLVNEATSQGSFFGVGVSWIVNKLVLPDNKSTQKVFGLRNGSNSDESEIVELAAGDLPNENFGDPGLLQHLLGIAIAYLNATKYILFTWDHGFGNGIFSRNVGSSTKMLTGAADPRNDLARRFFLSFGNFFYSEEKAWKHKLATLKNNQFPDVLTNNELSYAIKKAFPGGKIEVLAMMNCAMQLVDTGYAFRDTVKYLVAPQSVMWWEGYHYKDIIQTLNLNDMDAKAAALMILESERSKLQIEDPEGTLHSSLSVVDCRASIATVSFTGEAISVLISNEGRYKKNIKDTRDKLGNLSSLSEDVINYFKRIDPPNNRNLLHDHAPDLQYIDFYSFWSLLKIELSDNDPLKGIIERILNVKDDHIIKISPDPNVYNVNIPGHLVQLSASGVSLFFPTKIRDITNEPIKFIYNTFYNRFNPMLRTHFDRDTNWSFFLRNVYMT